MRAVHAEGGGMTWFLVDDGFSEHAKVDALGDDQALAVACWTLCATACARSLTDGLVTTPLLRRTLALWSPKDRVRAVAALVRVGLWTVVTVDTWQFHEWLEWQVSREEVLARRAQAAERQREKRRRDSAGGSASVTQAVTRDKSVSHKTLSSPLQSDPLPSEPFRSQDGREAGIGLLPHLYAEWRRVHTNLPGTGSVEQLAKVWRGEPAPTHAVRAHLDRVKLVIEAALAETDPKAWLTRTIEGFARDPYARQKAAGFELYASKPGSYARAAQVLSSAPSNFDHAPDHDGDLPACLGGPDAR